MAQEGRAPHSSILGFCQAWTVCCACCWPVRLTPAHGFSAIHGVASSANPVLRSITQLLQPQHWQLKRASMIIFGPDSNGAKPLTRHSTRLLVGDQRRLWPLARLEGVAPAEGHLHAAPVLADRQRPSPGRSGRRSTCAHHLVRITACRTNTGCFVVLGTGLGW